MHFYQYTDKFIISLHLRLGDPGRCSNGMEILTSFAQKLQQNLFYSVKAVTLSLLWDTSGIPGEAKRSCWWFLILHQALPWILTAFSSLSDAVAVVP